MRQLIFVAVIMNLVVWGVCGVKGRCGEAENSGPT
jgi:hypothetical protein